MSYLNTMKKDILDSKKKVSIIYDPNTEELQELESGELPSINSFYKKKIYRIIPHLNYPKQLDTRLGNMKCSGCKKDDLLL